MKTIEIILSLVDFFFRQWHEQQKQRERDELEANPAAWFESHFGGVQPSANKAEQADTRD